MPVTKTAKRALRSSKRKEEVNTTRVAKLEIAIRKATKSPTAASVKEAMSLADRVAKAHVIHPNKAARIKSRLSKLVKLAPSKKTTKKK